MNKRMDERVAQYLRLDSCLFQTTVRRGLGPSREIFATLESLLPPHLVTDSFFPFFFHFSVFVFRHRTRSTMTHYATRPHPTNRPTPRNATRCHIMPHHCHSYSIAPIRRHLSRFLSPNATTTPSYTTFPHHLFVHFQPCTVIFFPLYTPS